MLKGLDANLKVRAIARQDYVLARPEQSVDQVIREMISHKADNVVVVDHDEKATPIGVARAADIVRFKSGIDQEEAS